MCNVTEAGRELLRVDLSLLSKRGEPEEDPRLLLKSLPARPGTAPPPLRDVSRVSRAFQTIIYPPPPSSRASRPGLALPRPRSVTTAG